MIYLLLTLVSALATPLHALAATVSSSSPSFISLSDIPAFTNVIDASGAVDLSKVLNSIYGLCIGLAAVLAVIQLMYAGVLYMGGDSVTEKKVARQKITMALLGLLLVLAPAIVFGIIDKRILSLSLDTTPLGTSTTQNTPTGFDVEIYRSGALLTKGVDWTSTASDAPTICKNQGGTPTTTGGSTHCTPAVKLICSVYPVGSTPTSATGSDDGCCAAQEGCTVVKGVRGQNSCSCTAVTSTSGYFDAN